MAGTHQEAAVVQSIQRGERTQRLTDSFVDRSELGSGAATRAKSLKDLDVVEHVRAHEYGAFAGSHLVRVRRLFVHSGVRLRSIVNIDTRLSCMPMLKPLGLLCAACANTSFIHSNRHVDIAKGRKERASS